LQQQLPLEVEAGDGGMSEPQEAITMRIIFLLLLLRP
jgi:hypothetical protein